MAAEYVESADRLLERLVRDHDENYGFGAMTNSIYDTAWVSMLKHPKTGEWVFPDAFKYILDKQSGDGSWKSGPSDEFSVILSTLAALLSLHRHAKDLTGDSWLKESLLERATKATIFLYMALDQWDVDATLHVAFEITCPAVLRLLSNEGIEFHFRDKQKLLDLERKKLSICAPKLLYTRSVPLLHSLEAFTLHLDFDFDQLKHHKQGGSMMASPAATAAYLMRASEWDKEAEDYLRFITNRYKGTEEHGGCPSAFPSTYFEFSWIVENLLQNGFKLAQLNQGTLQKMREVLVKGLEAGKGIVGFAESLLPDADDTAKVLVALDFLGVQGISPDRLVAAFADGDRFKTYSFERNPSFSTNCNVLKALLLHKGAENPYEPQIITCVEFICRSWWESWEPLKDKWSLSTGYTTLVMAQALVKLYVAYDADELPSLPTGLLAVKVPICLMQALVRTIVAQNEDGSWGSPSTYDETAYAVLTLANASSLPIANSFQGKIQESVSQGQAFLSRRVDRRGLHAIPGDSTWIEKTCYGSPYLTQSYVLAALQCSVPCSTFETRVQELFQLPSFEKVERSAKFWRSLPNYKEVPDWLVTASLVEGLLMLPELKRIRLDVFPRKGLAPDKYLEYIPFTWIGANNATGAFANAQLIYDMMVISLLNYQADEFMESVVEKKFGARIPEAIHIIEQIFHDPDVNGEALFDTDVGMARQRGHTNGSKRSKSLRNNAKPSGPQKPESDSVLFEAHSTLKAFVETVLHSPRIQLADSYHKAFLRRELKYFLLAHVQQISDNQRFSKALESSSHFSDPETTFLKWVRGVSAQHTSAHYSYALFLCFANHAGCKYSFASAEHRYMSQDIIVHLASLCRMYNDYGSFSRDWDEKNVNSLAFPEFASKDSPASEALKKQKTALLRVTEYERRCLDLTLGALSEELRQDKKHILSKLIQLFCDVTDTYGWIYLARDIGVRT